MNASSTLLVGKTDSFEGERSELRYSFLKQEGLESEELVALPVDASKRCYFRLPNALLMDAPPPHEDTLSFHSIATFLAETGLTVPMVYASDHVNGFLLIEDLGELPYGKAIEQGISEELLYGETIKALAHLHQKVNTNVMDFETYDLETFLNNACLFLDWCAPSLSAEAKASFKEVWVRAYYQQPALPQSFLLRDVMVDNLLWLPEKQGFNRCGFIDFQAGLWGPITYDLVSLLEDARRDVDPDFAHKILKIYFDHFPNLSKDEFWASYSLWGAQRSTRILGVFNRLAKRDGKPHYLKHVPRVWKYLEQDLQHPSLKDVWGWFDKYLNKMRPRGFLDDHALSRLDETSGIARVESS